MTLEQVQRVVDHFHVGRVESFEEVGGVVWLKTIRGKKFVMLVGGSDRVRTEDQRLGVVEKKVERCLREDYVDRPSPETSYAHVAGKYYSLYVVQGE